MTPTQTVTWGPDDPPRDLLKGFGVCGQKPEHGNSSSVGYLSLAVAGLVTPTLQASWRSSFAWLAIVGKRGLHLYDALKPSLRCHGSDSGLVVHIALIPEGLRK